MMDHLQVLRRAWDILWSYRVLWVFGLVLALTTASGGAQFSGGSSAGGNGSSEPTFENVSPEMQAWLDTVNPEEVAQVVIPIVVTLVCVALVLMVVFTIARYVSETSLIKMVSDYEHTGEQLTLGQGLQLGWSREAWRLFMVELLIALPVILLVVVPAVVLGIMIATVATQNPAPFPAVPAVAAGVLGFLLFILIAIVLGVVLTLVKQFAWREIALNGQRVGPAFREGVALMRSYLKDVGLMWVILVGVNILWQIVSVPVGIIVAIAAAAIALIVFLMVSGVATAFVPGGINWAIGGVAGVLFFIPLIGLPLLLLQGFLKVYVSSVWTLTYRELDVLRARDVAPVV